MYVVIKQNRNKRLRGDMLPVQYSLDSHSQSELVLLWEARARYTADEGCCCSSPLRCSSSDGSVDFFYFMPEFKFDWDSLAPLPSFHIPVFLLKNVAGSRCS